MSKYKIVFSVFLLLLTILFSCSNSDKVYNTGFVLPCSEDSICSIKLFYQDNYLATFNNSDSIKKIIYELKNSKKEITKFSVARKIVFYDCHNKELFKIRYCVNSFRCENEYYVAAKDLELIIGYENIIRTSTR